MAGSGLAATSGLLATTRDIDRSNTASTSGVIQLLSAANVAGTLADLIELKINGISYQKGTSTSGDWYLNGQALTWKVATGFEIDTNDAIELITYS